MSNNERPLEWDDPWELDDDDDGWTPEQIYDMLDVGICPECGAELDLCGHAHMFTAPDDGHGSYWVYIEIEDDGDDDGV